MEARRPGGGRRAGGGRRPGRDLNRAPKDPLLQQDAVEYCNIQYTTASVSNTTPSTQQHPSPTQHPVLNSIPLQERPLRSSIKIPTRPPPAARRPPSRPPAAPPCFRARRNTQYSTVSISNTTPSKQQHPSQTQDTALNSMPLQERILKRSIKIPTRSPPAARPPARPPPARRAFVLNARPNTQQHPSPTQQPVLNSIRLQHSTQYSTACRCKRKPLRVLLKSRPARRPPPAARPPARPPPRRAFVLKTTPSTQQYPSPTQHPVLNSIRLQHSIQYSTASRCKRESL